MKKILMIAVIAFAALASAVGQVAPEGVELTLIDTVIPNNGKEHFVQRSVKDYLLPEFIKNIQEEEEVKGSVDKFEEAKTFYLAIEAATNEYLSKVAVEQKTKFVMYPSDYKMKSKNDKDKVVGYDYYLNGDTLQTGLIQMADEAQLDIEAVYEDPDQNFKGGVEKVSRLEKQKSGILTVLERLEKEKVKLTEE